MLSLLLRSLEQARLTSKETFVYFSNIFALYCLLQESAAAKKKRKKKKKKAAAEGGPEEAGPAEANGHHEGAASGQLPGVDGASAGLSPSAEQGQEDGDIAHEGEEAGGEAAGGQACVLHEKRSAWTKFLCTWM